MREFRKVLLVGGPLDGWGRGEGDGAYLDGTEEVVWLGPPGDANAAYRHTGKQVEGRMVWKYDAKLSDEKAAAMNPQSLVLPPSAQQPKDKGEVKGKIQIKHNPAKGRWEMSKNGELIDTRPHVNGKEDATAWLKEATGLEERK